MNETSSRNVRSNSTYNKVYSVSYAIALALALTTFSPIWASGPSTGKPENFRTIGPGIWEERTDTHYMHYSKICVHMCMYLCVLPYIYIYTYFYVCLCLHICICFFIT